jgi:hypothetical protein
MRRPEIISPVILLVATVSKSILDVAEIELTITSMLGGVAGYRCQSTYGPA